MISCAKLQRLTLILLVAVLAGSLVAATKPPQVTKQESPIYPPWLMGPEIGMGEVIVDFVVTEKGTTANVRALRSPNELLSSAAVAAVKQWTFTPGEVDGVRSKFPMRVPIVFHFEGFLGEEYLDGEFTCVDQAAGAELPALIRSTRFPYPGKLWRNKVPGEVTGEFRIARDGSVKDVSIRSASHPEFEAVVKKSLPQLRFAMDPTYVGEPLVRLTLRFAPPTAKKPAGKSEKPAAAKKTS